MGRRKELATVACLRNSALVLGRDGSERLSLESSTCKAIDIFNVMFFIVKVWTGDFVKKVPNLVFILCGKKMMYPVQIKLRASENRHRHKPGQNILFD